jgi:hypothetical protein
VLIGAAGGPAHALLNLNALSTNALISNALSNNALISNALTPTSLLDVGSLNGVVVEGIALPPNAGR